MASTPEVSEQQQLRKSLKNRHIQLIALGGAIGTGLFYGSSRSRSPGRQFCWHISSAEPRSS